MRTPEQIARVWLDDEQRPIGGQALLSAILVAQQDARAEGRREGIEAACRLVEHELGCDCSQTFRGDQHYASCRSAGTARLLVAIRALLSHEPLNCSRAPPPETK